MDRKQIALVALIITTVSALSALIAYRHALRSARSPSGALSTPRAASQAGGCVDFQHALDHTGETGCISGQVLRVFTSRNGNTFLDFCHDYRHCPFSSVIFASDRDRFGDLGALQGRAIEIRGPIVPYSGRAEIVLHDPQQIRVTDRTGD